METEVLGPNPITERDQLRLKRKTLEAVLKQCQRALQSICSTTIYADGSDADSDGAAVDDDNNERNKLCDLLKSRFECSDNLEKLESIHESATRNLAEEGSSWDMVDENDLWEGRNECGVTRISLGSSIE